MVQKPENKIAVTKTNCVTCNKEMILDNWEYRRRLRRNERGIFCSSKCSLVGKKPSQETIEKIRNAQKGISNLTRGRPGHTISEETKEKIRQAKKGISVKPDWEIVHKAAEIKKLKKYVITKVPVPDILYIEDGKLIAIEVEKKPWETMIRKKMDSHTLNTGYDKVILMWFLPNGEFMKEWILEDGKWTMTIG